MASQVQICNVAINNVGGQSISDIGENAREANLCSEYWDVIVDEVLSNYDWAFAQKWVTLAEVSEAVYDSIDIEFTKAYQLPSDYISFMRMDDYDAAYKIVGSHLLTDEDPAHVLYVRRISDTTKFPPHFQAVLIAKLSAALAIPLARKGARNVNWYEVYRNTLLSAVQRELNLELQNVEDYTSEHTTSNDTWLSARS